MRTSLSKRLIATTAAVSMAASGVLLAAPALAQDEESPSPEATTTEESPEATTTEEAPEAETTSDSLLPPVTAPETVSTYVGQSIQVRKNADGDPNANAVDFRWVVNQVNAESLNDLDVAIPLPNPDVDGLRSLIGSKNEPVTSENGMIFNFDGVNGVQDRRTLNLYHQPTEDLAVDARAEFTLDGEPVLAQDVVGKGGVLTATYIVQNQTRETIDVTIESGDTEKTLPVETDQPMVVIAGALIPQTWGQYNPGAGIYGADGRGNYLTQFIALPFAPLNANGEARFGYTAVIPEGEGFIPAMTLEISPLHHAPGEDEEEAEEEGGGIAKPDLSAGLQTASAGAEQLVLGIAGLGEAIGSAVGVTKEGLAAAIQEIKVSVENLCSPELLDCANPSEFDLGQTIADLEALSAELQETIDYINENGGDADELIAQLQELRDQLATIATAAQAGLVAAQATQAIACRESGPGSSVENCQNASQTVGQLEIIIGALNAIDSIVAGLQDSLPGIVGGINVAVLEALKSAIDGVTGSLKGIEEYLNRLTPALADLSNSFALIGSAIDAGTAQLDGIDGDVSNISGGKAQLSAGLGQVSSEVSAYLAKVISAAQATGESVTATLDTLKAELGGMKQRMADSPLIYGGGFTTLYAAAESETDLVAEGEALLASGAADDYPTVGEGVQDTDNVFGAYQLIFDPATNDQPNTIWRILLAFVVLAAAGFGLAKLAASRA